MTWFVPAPVGSTQLNALIPAVAVKSANTDRTSTTAHSDDPDLTVPVESGVTYVGRLVLFAGGVASNAGDLSLRWTFPSGSTIAWGLHGVTDAITSGVTADLTAPEAEGSSSPSGALTVGISSSFSTIAAWVWLSAGATGSLTLQWAQASSNANASRLRAGSHLVLERVLS